MKKMVKSRVPGIIILLLTGIILSCSSDKEAGLPEIETGIVSDITQTTAVSGGIIISPGDSDIIGKGVCWGLEANPTLSGSHTVDGTGKDDFVSNLNALTPATFYQIIADPYCS
jgi:hypothetical protein